MVVIQSAGITNVGKKRKANEDSFYLDDEKQLYVVADGMGGHKAGEVASMLVVETMRDYMERFNSNDDIEKLLDPDQSLSREANQLLSSISLANKGVHKLSKSRESCRGMGSTISLIYFTDESLIAANVGDSPIYLIHNKKIEQLSVTHNVITEQMAIDPDAARKISDQYKYMLTRGMGIEETVLADISEIQCFKGDKFVISSDGLSDKVSPEEILEVVESTSPERACQLLVNIANDRGGDDNITVIVLNIKAVTHGKGGFLDKISRVIFPLKK